MGKIKKTEKTRQINMLEGSLHDKILLFALPLAASSILQQLFNSADVAVVGRFAGSKALAAVGSNGSVISLLINLFVGLSVGANVIVAKYIGQKKNEKVKEAVHTAMLLAVVSGIFLLFLGFFIARPLLELMKTPDDVIDLAVLYLRIYFVGMPFFMVYNFGSAILRSMGDTKRPLYCLFLSGILNVCLNLFLVIVFRLGVAGVGIATVVSNGVSAALILHFLMKEEDPIRLSLSQLAIKKEHLRKIARIGIPAGVQGMVFSLSNVCIQTAINGFGSDGVAGSAAALNFEYFCYFTINAFGQAAVTFISQNYGAGKYDRCRKVLRIAVVFGIISCGVMCLTFVGGRRLFIRFYTTDKAVITYALIRMTHVLTFEFIASFHEVVGSGLRGIGYSLLPAVLTIIGACGFRILWVYTIFQKFNSFSMLMNVYPVTWAMTGGMMLLAYVFIQKKTFG